MLTTDEVLQLGDALLGLLATAGVCLGLREKLGGLLAVDHLVDESLRHELRIIKDDWKNRQHKTLHF